MKSAFYRKYNHDSVAKDYDENVKNKNNPVREGYDFLLSWVGAKIKSSKIILDLGSGTGNTVNSFPGGFEKIVCVDISNEMIKIAKEKLKKKKNIIFIISDLLDVIDKVENMNIDTVVSTYAIHHLTQKEKHRLFEKIYSLIPKNGKIIFGDLMFENKKYEKEMKLKYPDLIEDFNDEFYWYIDKELEVLKKLGFSTETKQFSDLSWGIYGVK
jgi:putative AdoMet-dependent methyltransferase